MRAGYPSSLAPLSVESVEVNGVQLEIPKAKISLTDWKGPEPHDDFGGKAFVESDGTGTFAELAVLQMFVREDWQAVWVSSFQRKYYQAYSTCISPPSVLKAVLERVAGAQQYPNGAWDLCCVRGTDVLFVELKRAKRDWLREAQLNWLRKSMEVGFTLDNFLLVEWTLSGEGMK
jgi:hypothetical protein